MCEMKDSGIDGIGTIPYHWGTNKLKYISQFTKGLSITKADLLPTGQAVVSYGQVHSKENSGTDLTPNLVRHVAPVYWDLQKSAIAPYGSFIFADTSEDYDGIGNCVYVDDYHPVMGGYHTIIVRDINIHNPRYLAYLFLTDGWRKQLRENSFGIKVFSATQKNIKDTKIIIPSAREQDAIVKYLDRKCNKIHKAVQDIQLQISTLEEYKKSVITKAVTKGLNPDIPMKDSGIKWLGKIPANWKFMPIKYLCKIPISDGTHQTPTYTDATEGTPFLSSKDVTLGIINWRNIKYITQDLHHQLQREISPKMDDILLAKNGTTGVAAMVDRDVSFDIYVTLADIRVRQNLVLPQYMLYCLNSLLCKNQFNQRLIGIGVPNLHLNIIKNTKVTVPIIEEQKKIVAELDRQCRKIDATVSAKRTQLATLESYKKSVIYEYVTGKKEVPFDE